MNATITFPAGGISTPLTSKSATVCLEGIDAGYGKKKILHGLSLAVEAGEIVTLIGANGAGKSTLLKVAMGLLKPWQGSVWLNGHDNTYLPVHERARRGLSYLMQGGPVFPSLTVQDNIEMGALTVPPSQRVQTINDVLELFPMLRERLSTRAGLLSGGQRQALALTMVLAQRPRVLLLDEPSAGLAPKLARETLLKVREANEHFGITVLLVEQRVREALEIAHRAVALVNGAVAAETYTPQEWLQDGVMDAHFFGDSQRSLETKTEIMTL